ncbi:choline/ethanolamine transporter flvcr2a [Leptinotarsa decemlineata]|uniref:choline/ethanolamine transporter flvcr2a n=1 Tax=Leptinotarsa decemlineata TaxID=7539 RepID=UPI003D307433
MNGENTEVKSLPEMEKIKVYGTRWAVLAIFVMYSASNAYQWIQFSIITDVITKYYGVSTLWVDWTSMIYMVLYVPFVFPASYLLEKLGLRKSVLIGMIGTCAGSWLKLGSVSQDRFWVAFVGQSIVAFCQIFVLSVPARVAAVWFGPSEVSSACSIGVFGNQLGVALGFFIPPLLVPAEKSMDETSQNLYIFYGSLAVISTVILLLVLFFFKDAPPTPPSYAVAQQDSTGSFKEFVTSLKNLLRNRSFMLLLSAYGINTGVFYAISTLLNQIILHYYPDGNEDAGRIGLAIVVAGMMGSVCCGVILDRYHKFKETTLVVYALALIGMVLFTFTISTGLYVVYIISFLLGFFMTGLLPVGFELAAELTYPEPEGTSAGLLNAAANLCGIIFTNFYSAIFYHVDVVSANISMSLMLVVGTILLACTSPDLKRQAAQGEKNGVP